MIKKILCLMLALVCVASMAVIGVSAADDTKIYFEVPAEAGDYSAVFCHIWIDGGDSFAAWQSKKEKCTQVEGNLYSYDISKVGALEDGSYYGVIFSTDGGWQTYDTIMGSACYGDTLYCEGTVYENPADSSKTALAAFWKGQDAAVFGPTKQISSIGNLVGTCCAPGVTDEILFTNFLTANLENAREYAGKDDQAIIDDLAKALNFDNATVAALIADAGVEVAWEAGEEVVATTAAPEVEDATTAAPEVEDATTAPVDEEETTGVKVTVDGVEYIAQVGDIITYTANLTTPKNIENVQAFTAFDAATLKLVEADAATRFPNMTGVVANAADGVVYFNASEISAGFDFTAGQTLIYLQFEVVGEADATIDTTIEEMVEYFGGDYVTGSEIVADGVSVVEALEVPVVVPTTTEAETTEAETTEAATTAPVVTDATSATDAPEKPETDVPPTGATVAIAVTIAAVVMAMAAAVVLRKKANG